MSGIDRAGMAAYLNQVVNRYAQGGLLYRAALARIMLVLPCCSRDRAHAILAANTRFEVQNNSIVEVPCGE